MKEEALIDSPEKCTKQLAQNARKNAKFLSSLAETVQYIAKSAFQLARTAIVNIRDSVSLLRLVASGVI